VYSIGSQEKAPAVVRHPEARTKEGSSLIEHTISPAGDPFTYAGAPPDRDQDHPHACTDGYVYMTYTVFDEEVADEVELIETLPCRRCAEAQ
jgi:hypothetical protein